MISKVALDPLAWMAVLLLLPACARSVVIAHRGASGHAPENTLPAFEKAVELGADYVECDVHLSRDGEVVVIHDVEVERTADGKGRIEDLSLEEIKALDAGSWYGEAFAGTKIPTLEEVIERVRGRVRLVVELKSSRPEIAGAVVERIRSLGAGSSCLVISFNHPFLRSVREMAPEIAVAPLFNREMVFALDVSDIVEIVESLDAPQAIMSWRAFGPTRPPFSFTMALHKAGRGLWIYTVPRSLKIPFMLLGIDGIITNFP